MAVALAREAARKKSARHLFRTRFGAHLSERLDALSRDRFHRLRASSRHSGRRSCRWRNICTARMVIATSNANASGQEIVLYRGQEHAPRDGFQVHLTIDLNLQNIVENEIDAAMREYHPQKATIILMRPQTGEILAMANRPNFDLNLRAKAKPEQMKNRAIIDMMEPGSTFKIVTAASALNERKVQPDTTIFCENGVWNFGGRISARSQSVRRTERARYPREIEQHRRGQTGDERRRGKILRIHPPFWFWRSHRHRIAGRNRRHGPFAAIVEQDFDHAHSDGPRNRCDTIANDGRRWRQSRMAANSSRRAS